MQSYQQFGQSLKKFREKRGKSISQVARELKLDRTYLSKLENGHEKPSFATLNFLISHYSIPSEEAVELFQLLRKAGVLSAAENPEKKEVTNMADKNAQQMTPVGVQVNVQPDKVQILYTDSVFVSSNQYGVILDVAQTVGPNNQTIVARIGMSREHAKVLLDVLGKHLAMTTSSSKKQ